MAIGILGNKVGMTQIFDAKGDVIPVTIIKSEPCYITQIKSKETCGYNAIQIGYLELASNKKSLTKPELGHLSKSNLPPLKHLREFKTESLMDYEVGNKFDVKIFKVGQKVSVTGISIGKGNAGNIKRNHFTRGGMSHGSKHHRLQGSMGAGTSPGRVFPGKKMPGRMGTEKTTIKGMEILSIDLEGNIIVIKGSIPGKSGNLVTIKAD